MDVFAFRFHADEPVRSPAFQRDFQRNFGGSRIRPENDLGSGKDPHFTDHSGGDFRVYGNDSIGSFFAGNFITGDMAVGGRVKWPENRRVKWPENGLSI